ncbi:hypothetical protein WS87_12690 [Burkholderia sp. MSMB0856]|uniref:hypothetical protein n=1 Tax=Burkholderia sp. MSMB0856 TaxID=1637869 RepID=UPI00075665A1|nr:hypothetical protein [Burkholderia sp. MSMB0856]AOJ87471.1 hypothetical protein WS87_12690 [Burkholderia sp. MSMB0856]KVH39177.1 hypothetical protein WS87_06885 [Burkholderia sp. MSMB0856]
MKAIQKIQDKIAAQHKAIERVTSDRNAAQASIDGANAHLVTLDELKSQRRRVLAEAMVAKKTANTAAIDAQIANAEQQHATALAAAGAARDALEIYDEGLRIAEAELASLEEQRREAIRVEILAYHDAGLEKYLAAVAAMEEGVAAMVAAGRAWKHAGAALDHQPFPARGERVLTDIRESGVRVPHTASRLADPKVAAEYTSDYPEHWYLPAWADPLTRGFAEQHIANLVDSLVDAGVDCTAPARPEPEEKQVKVRIIKGSIQAEPRIVRSAATGKVISSEPVTFSEGDDVWIGESLARSLKVNRMVAIHGEDSLPSSNPQSAGPEVVDASPPDDRPAWRPTWRQDQPSEYAGNFHRLDMSSYE